MKNYKIIPSVVIIDRNGIAVTFFDKFKKLDIDCSKDFEMVLDEDVYQANKGLFSYGSFIRLRTYIDQTQCSTSSQLKNVPRDNGGMITSLKYNSATKEVTIRGLTLRGMLEHYIMFPRLITGDSMIQPATSSINSVLNTMLKAWTWYNYWTLQDSIDINTFSSRLQLSASKYDDLERYGNLRDGLEGYVQHSGYQLNTMIVQNGFDESTGKKLYNLAWWADNETWYDDSLTSEWHGVNYEIDIVLNNKGGGDKVDFVFGTGKQADKEVDPAETTAVTGWTNCANTQQTPQKVTWTRSILDQTLYGSWLEYSAARDDFSSAKDNGELNMLTRMALGRYMKTINTINFSIDSDVFEYALEIGDKMYIKDPILGQTLGARVTNKIYRIESGKVSMEYSFETIQL